MSDLLEINKGTKQAKASNQAINQGEGKGYIF